MKDIEGLFFKKTKQFTNKETGELFNKDILDGYFTYKGVPFHRASGFRQEDRTFVSKKTKQPFTVSKFSVKLRNGEDYQDEDLKEDGILTLRLSEQTNRAKGNKFYTLTSEGMWYGKDDPRNTTGFRVGNMLVPLNGIIESHSTKDQWEDDVFRLKLETNNKYAVTMLTNDTLADEDKKAGYTATTPDELFSAEELEGLAKQFPYFERFKKAFDGVEKEDESKIREKVTPSSF